MILPAALLGGCVTLRAIPEPIPSIDFLGSSDFIVIQPYDYRIGSTSHTISIPQGFVTDYASIPWAVRGLLPKQSRYSRAAVIHDYLYWSQICTKKQADNIMMISMKELGVSRWKRKAIYTAVDRAGGSAWVANAAERQAGKPKVVPQRYFGLATTMSWPQARQRLINDGIRDPAFQLSPGACAIGNEDVVP